MQYSKLFASLLLIIFLSACVHHQPDSYSWRSRCLEGLIQVCKERGLEYTNTNPVCRKAVLHGIYALSDEQLMFCKQQDQARLHPTHNSR